MNKNWGVNSFTRYLFKSDQPLLDVYSIRALHVNAAFNTSQIWSRNNHAIRCPCPPGFTSFCYTPIYKYLAAKEISRSSGRRMEKSLWGLICFCASL